MEERMCNERHRRLEEKINSCEEMGKDNRARIGILEKSESAMVEKLAGLIQQLGTLNKTLTWFMTSLVGALIGFFFWAIQTGLFN